MPLVESRFRAAGVPAEVRMMSATPGGTPPYLFDAAPPSPISEPEWLVVPTDDLGMVADGESNLATPQNGEGSEDGPAVKARKPRRKITYLSRHFAGGSVSPTKKARRNTRKDRSKEISEGVVSSEQLGDEETHDLERRRVAAQGQQPATPPETPARHEPRILYGVNIDEWSSDSSLTDVPEDIGPDPFLPQLGAKAEPELQAFKVKTKTQRRHTKSPYFPHPHKHRPTFLATLPFPPLSHPNFGLMQERLARDPFRLLIATIFLNKTPGARAMPVFYELMTQYPSPTDLAAADVTDVTRIIHVLGFQNQRARKCVEMAKIWVQRAPEMGKRYRKLNYPVKGDGRDVKEGDSIGDDDERVAWEISHLPGLGPYSHDSWRMFCRDMLRNQSQGWNGEGAAQPDFEPEWKRVLPLDKELRAWLTWMWMKEGWIWNKETGQRTKASDELMEKARGGGIVVEPRDSEHLEIQSIEGPRIEVLQDEKKVEHPAGDFLLSNTGAGNAS